MPSQRRRPVATVPPPRARGTVPVAGSIAVGAALGLFYLALAPHIAGNKDASEFTLDLALGGVPHPTGYPIYILLGHPFVLLLHRFGAPWPFAANAWSAIGGAVAMALHHALAARVIPASAPLGRTGRFVAATLATLLIGLNPIWLLDTMLAEVYSWHLAWVCGTCLFALGLLHSLSRSREPWSARRLASIALGWGALCGIGMAHHVTAILFILPLSVALVIALARAKAWRWWLPIGALAAALIPLSSYGFVLWRAWHPAAFQWPRLEPTLVSVIAHVTGKEYRDLLGGFAPGEVQADLFRRDIYPILFPGLAVFLWGCLRARTQADRMALWGLFAAAAIQTVYGFSYGVSDPSSYFQPNLAIAVLAIPLMASALAASRRVLAIAATVAVVTMSALAASWVPFGFAIRTGMEIAERRVRELWRSIPVDRGFVLWRDDRYGTLVIYQLLEGEKPDLWVTDPNTLSWAPVRRRILRRFRFDPLQGLEPLTEAKGALIPENVNRLTPLPVVVFDTRANRLEPLLKPEVTSRGLAR